MLKSVYCFIAYFIKSVHAFHIVCSVQAQFFRVTYKAQQGSALFSKHRTQVNISELDPVVGFSGSPAVFHNEAPVLHRELCLQSSSTL